MSPKITIAICTYNRYDLLPTCVQSCLDQSLSQDDYEIIIVDNSPASELRIQMAESYRDILNVTYIEEDTPGLSNARNVALARSRASYIAYIDDDAIANRGWIENILAAFQKYEGEAGVVGGRIDPIWEIGRPSWLPRSLEGMLTILDWGGETRKAHPKEWFAGANIAFSVKALRKIGGFDKNLGRNGKTGGLLSNEESQAAEEVENLGYCKIYAPHAIVDHLVEKKRCKQSWLRQRQAWQAVSDFSSERNRTKKDIETYWHGVSSFMNLIPVKYRTPAGLYQDFEDPEIVERQVNAVYCMTILMLSQTENVYDFWLQV